MQCLFEICPNYQFSDALIILWHGIWNWLHQNTHKGLLLWGPVGVGKSTIIRVIAEYQRRINGLDERGMNIGGFTSANCANVCSEYVTSGIEGIKRFTTFTICFDELGREPIPCGYFGLQLNVMQYILQIRYDRYKNNYKTFITTNLKPESIAKLYGEHIYDRCKEMFYFVEIVGNSKRK